MSDHRLVLCRLGVQSRPIRVTTRRYRPLRNIDTAVLTARIQNSIIANSSYTDPDAFCLQLEADVISILDDVAPFRTSTLRHCNPSHFLLSPEARAAKVFRRRLEAKLPSVPSHGEKRA